MLSHSRLIFFSKSILNRDVDSGEINGIDPLLWLKKQGKKCLRLFCLVKFESSHPPNALNRSQLKKFRKLTAKTFSAFLIFAIIHLNWKNNEYRSRVPRKNLLFDYYKYKTKANHLHTHRQLATIPQGRKRKLILVKLPITGQYMFVSKNSWMIKFCHWSLIQLCVS